MQQSIQQGGLMKVTTILLDTAGEIAHRMAISMNALMLTVAAEARQDMARDHVADWAAGAVTFFGTEILKAFQSNKPDRDREMERSMMSLAMAVWVCDSVYGGLAAETFVASDLRFTITHDGIVRYDRLPKPDDRADHQ
ncbi:hypothetical protein [Xanthomonas oryzae]|uniref:hypothetical protein n=1 Tax=Xanthomonas oryzae TaxID=347 RepID=UPI00035E24D9|nr:hypothetical protein [Xanthomonas oryzae]